jgi:hypothetical protein
MLDIRIAIREHLKGDLYKRLAEHGKIILESSITNPKFKDQFIHAISNLKK